MSNLIPSNIQLLKFDDTQKARKFLRDSNFDVSKEKWLPMEEGFEYIFLFEYPHKYDSQKIARMCDLVGIQRKLREGESIPQLFDFVQVAIKTNDHE